MRLYKRGKYWYIDFIYRRRRYQRSLRTTSKKLAEMIRKDIEAKIVKGEFLGIWEDSDILFRDFAEVYLDYARMHKTPKAFSVDTNSLKSLLPEFGNLKLKEITQERIERFKAGRIASVKPASVNRELGTLRTMLNRAKDWGYIKDVPKIQFFTEPPGRVRYLNIDELKRLRKALEKAPKHLRNIVLLALNTGMRRGEILTLRWSDIDLENKVIILRDSKTHSSRIIPLNSEAHEILSRIERKGEYIFPGKDGGPIKEIKTAWRTLLKNAQIEDFRFHDLRHTFASWAAMSGADLKTLQELLGHKSLRMVMRYSHLTQDHLKKAVERLGQKWDSLKDEIC